MRFTTIGLCILLGYVAITSCDYLSDESPEDISEDNPEMKLYEAMFASKNYLLWSRLYQKLDDMTDRLEKLHLGQTELIKRNDDLSERLKVYENQKALETVKDVIVNEGLKVNEDEKAPETDQESDVIVNEGLKVNEDEKAPETDKESDVIVNEGLTTQGKETVTETTDTINESLTTEEDETLSETTDTSIIESQMDLTTEVEEVKKGLETQENETLTDTTDTSINESLPIQMNQPLAATSKSIKKRQVHFTSELEEIINRLETQNDLLRKSFIASHTWTTIFQCEVDNAHLQIDFNKTWNKYKKGFRESLNEGEIYLYFIGLERLYFLTTYEYAKELRITIKDFNGQIRYAQYNLFQIGDENEKYALKKLGDYIGNAGDILRAHKGYKFSTYDQDNDNNVEENCAANQGVGWFDGDCNKSDMFDINGLQTFWHYSTKSLIMEIV